MAQKVRDAMTSNPKTIEQGRPISDAARIMKDADTGIVPVVEGGRLIGTITDRDIAIRVVAEGKDPQATKVDEVASREIVTVDPPVLVTVSESVLLPLTCTLPKARLGGLDPSAPAVTPVPVSGIFSVGFDAFDVIATLPLTAPALAGLNNTLKLALWPAARVTGALIPLTLNPVPLTPI